MWKTTEITPLGVTRIIIRNPKNQKKYSVGFVVVAENLRPLIEAQATQHMTLISVNKENFMQVIPSRPKEAEVSRLSASDRPIQRFSDAFNRPLETFSGKVSLEVEPNAEQVIIPPRRVPTALKEKLKKELNKLVDEKIISTVDQPKPWVNSLVVTTKRSGSLRIGVDPKHLNRAVRAVYIWSKCSSAQRPHAT